MTVRADQGFIKAYVGKDARAEFKVAESAAIGRQRTMQQFYAKVIAHMVQWGAALYETAMKRGPEGSADVPATPATGVIPGSYSRRTRGTCS